MPESKLVTLGSIRLLAQQTKSYVDGKVGSTGDIQSGDTVKTFSEDYKPTGIERVPDKLSIGERRPLIDPNPHTPPIISQPLPKA